MSGARSWRLESAEERNREHPDSFFIPAREEREALAVGARVQLLFDPVVPDGPAERMWVTIDERVGTGYRGELENQPVNLTDLDAGDAVEFSPEHVATILYPAGALAYDPELLVLVSPMVFEARRPEVLVYEPELLDDARASGWSALEGSETDEWLNDPDADNVVAMDLGWLVGRFPETLPAIEAAEPGWWVWRPSETRYIRLDDEEPAR